MTNDWAHSYRTVANTMKQTADTSAAEPFNPYLKGGVSGAKFNALAGQADYAGNILSTYDNSMKQYQEGQARSAIANKKDILSNRIKEQKAKLNQEADLIAKSDDLKQQMFTPLFGKGFNKDEVQEAINFSIKIDNAIQQGKSLNDVANDIKETSDDKEIGLDPIVSQYLNQYAMKAYNLYGNTYQPVDFPDEQPSWLNKVSSFIDSEANTGWNKLKSSLGY